MIKKYLSLFLIFVLMCIPNISAKETGLDISITLSDEYPLIDDTVTATVSITNNGDEVTLSNAYLAYNDGTQDTPVSTTIFTDPIANGANISDSFDITVSALPSSVIFYANEAEAARYDIIPADVYSFSDVTAITASGDDTAKLYYTVNGKLNNIGNAGGENITIELATDTETLNTYSVDSVSAGESKDFSINAEFTKEAFNFAEMDFTITAKKADTVLCTDTGKLVNETFITDITLNEGNDITVLLGIPFTPAVEFIPATAASEYAFTVEDSSVAEVSADGKTITGLSLGQTKLTITAGTYAKPVNLTVSRAPEKTELSSVSVYYIDTEENKITLPFSKDFSFLDYGEYRVDIPSGITRINFDITSSDGVNLTYAKLKSKDEKKTAMDSIENITTPLTGGYDTILITATDSENQSDSKTYKFLINNCPEISESFPAEINIFTNLKYEINLDDYYSDYEDEDKLNKIEVKNSETGEIIGKHEIYDEENYWTYTSALTEGEIPVIFSFYDDYEAKTDVSAVLKAGTDNEKPYWAVQSQPMFSNITKNSAKVTWSRASDNDRIAYYQIYYYEKKMSLKYETLTVLSNETETSFTLNNLSDDTTYTVYIEAFDRSENSVSSATDKFTTKKSGSSSSSSSSSGSKKNSSTSIVPAVTIPAKADKFSDLSGYDWAKTEIEELAEKGIISGISENEYAPSNNIKRADFVLLLVRGLGLSSDEIQTFADVPSDSYYANAVGVAKALGIISGTGNDMFIPESNILRQDMLVMAKRALEYKNKALKQNSDIVFADDTLISDYARDAVYMLAALNIVKGDTSGNVNPQSFTTRAEAAVILYRILAV